jgi:DNA-binding LytR/AlgR family response regulator
MIAQMPSPTAIVAEDELVLRQELVSHLGQLWPELAIVGVASDGVHALELVERLQPDVLFLDIQMPSVTGIEVARQLNGKVNIVFVTAFDEYAVPAFEQGAIDYLLKPYDLDRLCLSIARVQARLADPPRHKALAEVLKALERIQQSRNYLRWIRASAGSEIRLVLVEDIVFFQADTKYTTVATLEGDAIVRMSLKQLRSQLDPDLFIAIHRSTIVNIKFVRAVRKALDGSMLLILKGRAELLSVSEANRHSFRMM